VKQTPDMNRIQAAMRPGAIVHDGFLGADRRNLADILAADQAAVARLGLTHEKIAEGLRRFREAGVKGLGNTVSVKPHFEARVDGVRGRLPCPFGHPGLCDKTFTVLRNLRLSEEIVVTDLQLHMIAEHGFYEGEGSPHRLPPDLLARVLEMGEEG
jgi:hypothetical protein